MRCGVIARKLGMSRVFSDDGEHVPVTVLRIEDVEVLSVKSIAKDGYTSVQLGFSNKKPKNIIAVTGTITMITGGKIIDNVNTPYSVGYINLLGFAVFVPVTMVMARIGAKVVHKIDKKLLSKIFGIFLILVSIRSFIEYLSIN